MNVDIEQSRVPRLHQWLQDAEALARQVEVQVHRLPVNRHFASARLHADHGSGCLALAVAIGSCFLVDVVRTLLGREHAAEIEQVDTVKFNEVIGIKITLAVSIVHDIVVFLLVKLR